MESCFKNCSCFCYPQQFWHLCYVDVISLIPFFIRYHIHHSIINFNGMRVEPILLLKLSVEEIKYFAFVFGGLFQDSFEHRPCSLNSDSIWSISCDEFIYVNYPDIQQTRPCEVSDSIFENSKRLFEICILP